MLSCLPPWGSTASCSGPQIRTQQPPSQPPTSAWGRTEGAEGSAGHPGPSPTLTQPILEARAPCPFAEQSCKFWGGTRPPHLCLTQALRAWPGVPSIPGWTGGKLPSVLLQPPAFPGTLSGLWPPSPQPCGLQGTPTGTFQVILAGLHRCGAGQGGRGLATGVDPRTLDSPACWPRSLASSGNSLGAGIRLECGSQAKGRESPT